jgi:hypothetical protein
LNVEILKSMFALLQQREGGRHKVITKRKWIRSTTKRKKELLSSKRVGSYIEKNQSLDCAPVSVLASTHITAACTSIVAIAYLPNPY